MEPAGSSSTPTKKAMMVVPKKNLRDFFTRENSARSRSSRSLTSTKDESSSPSLGSFPSPLRRRGNSPHSQRKASHDRHVNFADPLVIEEDKKTDEDDRNGEDVVHLTPEERDAYFYSAKDLETFGKDSALTALMYIKRKEAGVPWEEKDDYTIRGLEDMMRTFLRDKSVREEHRNRVLEEQKRIKTLKKTGKNHEDPADRLRYVSLHSSKAERIRALHRAREDAGNFKRTSSGRLIMQKMISKLSLK